MQQPVTCSPSKKGMKEKALEERRGTVRLGLGLLAQGVLCRMSFIIVCVSPGKHNICKEIPDNPQGWGVPQVSPLPQGHLGIPRDVLSRKEPQVLKTN